MPSSLPTTIRSDGDHRLQLRLIRNMLKALDETAPVSITDQQEAELQQVEEDIESFFVARNRLSVADERFLLDCGRPLPEVLRLRVGRIKYMLAALRRMQNTLKKSREIRAYKRWTSIEKLHAERISGWAIYVQIYVGIALRLVSCSAIGERMVDEGIARLIEALRQSTVRGAGLQIVARS